MSGVVESALISSSAANRLKQIWGNGSPSSTANLKKLLDKINHTKDVCDQMKKILKKYSYEERSINKFPNYRLLYNFYNLCREA
ncbi:hypothetical protein SOVF_105260 [Spinacia oleracea]|nr:hypothetical protein SOVF_105260 [Spinacia oleracea]